MRRLIPPLPGAAWLVAAAAGVTWVGIGMAAPYVFLYLAQARHLGTAAAGLLLSAAGAATIVATPLIGVLIDLAGPRLILLASLLLAGVAGVGFGVARGSVPLGVAAFGYALGQRVTTPAGATLLYGQVGPASRSNAFAVRYAAINTGASIGGLAGGLMIRIGHPATFQLAFIAQGAVCAAAAGLVLLVPATARPAEPTRRRDRPRRAGPYRDRVFLRVWLLTLLLYAAGISQITRGFALYVTATLHRSPALLGVALAVTTLTIAAAQLPVLRLAAGRRRMAVAAATFGTLAAGWLLALLAGNLPHAAVAVAVCGSAAVFGVTETLMSPTLPPVAAERAPAGSEGRYNAAFSLTLFGGGTIAPAMAGMLLTLGPVALPLTCAAAALLGALAAALLDRNLPASIATIPA